MRARLKMYIFRCSYICPDETNHIEQSIHFERKPKTYKRKIWGNGWYCGAQMAIVHLYHQNSLLISNEYEIWIAIGNPNNTSVDKCVDYTHSIGHCLHAHKRAAGESNAKKKKINNNNNVV